MNRKPKMYLCVAGACLALITGGCISIPTSPTPRFYMLSSADENQVGKKIIVPSGMIIAIGPVKIPEYLDRPQIVTQAAGQIQLAQFDRWGESLDLGMARLVREDLSGMLAQAKLISYPWNPLMAVKYQVLVEIVQLQNDLSRGMYFAVQWTVIDVQHSKIITIKNSVFRLPIVPQNYSGIAQTLSKSCTSLSSQIAQVLGTLK